ncbi:bactofilin family protein [Ruegeria atlantica]|uniref:Polymer-forming cytoskeletal n=1 Tax=Ruegeria atlantica TaxID=81569 RepID=A0A0P1EHC7_9RHOB|nr:polymer-forming cytoskeletal protein [Ruegeria atlantica]CUH49761.1 Polymer-forming cytoskeletal [Ruegeria atlantica]
MASSIVEKDLTIEGNVRSEGGSVDVKGQIVGDVSAGSITVQLSGSVDGALSAKKITLEGKHNGSLSCDDLKLASSSQVRADVVARTMEAESGASVVGKVEITGVQ